MENNFLNFRYKNLVSRPLRGIIDFKVRIDQIRRRTVWNARPNQARKKKKKIGKKPATRSRSDGGLNERVRWPWRTVLTAPNAAIEKRAGHDCLRIPVRSKMTASSQVQRPTFFSVISEDTASFFLPSRSPYRTRTSVFSMKAANNKRLDNEAKPQDFPGGERRWP